MSSTDDGQCSDSVNSSSSSSNSRCKLPSLIVFDLDDCLKFPETFELPCPPTIPVRGILHPLKKQYGTIGMKAGRNGPTLQLFPGARQVLYELYTKPEYKDVQIAVASTSLEPSYSYMGLQGIEIVPGVSISDMIQYHQVGRSGKLSPDKSTHFQLLHEESQIPYSEMLFFDDCNWDDHCTRITIKYGVVSQRTPSGLGVLEFQKGMEKFKRKRSR